LFVQKITKTLLLCQRERVKATERRLSTIHQINLEVKGTVFRKDLCSNFIKNVSKIKVVCRDRKRLRRIMGYWILYRMGTAFCIARLQGGTR
jgi:hypothetical protein